MKDFVVIGVGLPRTGCTSLTLALERLLGGRCYSMFTVFNSDDNMDIIHWEKAALNSDSLREEDWYRLLNARGFTSGLDFPIALYYKHLLKIYPRAKVILTVRPAGGDSKKWYQSVKNTIIYNHDCRSRFPVNLYNYLVGTFKKYNVSKYHGLIKPEGFNHSMYSAVKAGEKEAMEFYRQWIDDVVKTVPKERLLIFDVADGWEPLCEFLQVPLQTNQEFPRINDTEMMRQRMEENVRQAHRWMIYIPTALLLSSTTIMAAIIYFTKYKQISIRFPDFISLNVFKTK